MTLRPDAVGAEHGASVGPVAEGGPECEPDDVGGEVVTQRAGVVAAEGSVGAALAEEAGRHGAVVRISAEVSGIDPTSAGVAVYTSHGSTERTPSWSRPALA